jgi:prophage regulatory protein
MAISRNAPDKFPGVTARSEGSLNAYELSPSVSTNAPLGASPKTGAPRKPASRPDGSGTKFLRWPQVEARVALSRTTVWRLMREGDFPKPIPISRGRVAWVEEEISAWIASHIEAAHTA